MSAPQMQPFQQKSRHPDVLQAEEQNCSLNIRQSDVKPLLKALAGLCLFFGAMAVIATIGAALVIVVKNVIRLF